MGGSSWRKYMVRWNLSLANSLFSYEKTEKASEYREKRSVPVGGRGMRIRQNVVERV